MWEKLKAVGLLIEGKGRRNRGFHTVMIQVLSKLHIPMASRRDMKISLHFVPLQATENPTRALASPRRLFELLPPLDLVQDMPDMGIALHLLFKQHGVLLEQMHAPSVDPMAPARGVLAQHVTREDPIARSILHVDVKVVAGHGDDDIEVDL